MLKKMLNLRKVAWKDILQETLSQVVGNGECKIAVVKSNICGYYFPSREVIEVVLRFLVERCGEVYFGDTPSTLYNVEKRIRDLGLDKLNVRSDRLFVGNLMKVGENVKVEVPNKLGYRRYPIPSIVLKADILINIAKIGRHPSTQVTGALKNLFGLVASKAKFVKYHPIGMDKVVVDVAQIIKPSLNLVEVGDKLVVSDDVLEADIIATRLLGIDPAKVRHFRLYAEITGRDLDSLIEEISHQFPNL
ncbi:hypothetical protein B6U74_04465 [Candidatus Bathyarchaeota archaeon ex4484_205]|nr:MAG: hypothetical protein B6U74_04465 [Candidatus Bathyarchaeota archaeon ex4484_205]